MTLLADNSLEHQTCHLLPGTALSFFLYGTQSRARFVHANNESNCNFDISLRNYFCTFVVLTFSVIERTQKNGLKIQTDFRDIYRDRDCLSRGCTLMPDLSASWLRTSIDHKPIGANDTFLYLRLHLPCQAFARSGPTQID